MLVVEGLRLPYRRVPGDTAGAVRASRVFSGQMVHTPCYAQGEATSHVLSWDHRLAESQALEPPSPAMYAVKL